jgi:hypothetical protein
MDVWWTMLVGVDPKLEARFAKDRRHQLNPNASVLRARWKGTEAARTPHDAVKTGTQEWRNVYGPAGYRFGDYARLGLPLTILVAVLVLVLVPLEWGLVR